MSTNEGPTIAQVRITHYVLSTLAVFITCFRLYVRFSRRKLWWDDAWAALSALLMLIYVVSVELLINPVRVPQGVRVVLYYMCDEIFCSVVWTARLSILFTIIRISFGLMRRLLGYVTVTWLIAWFILLSQVVWVCERESKSGWKKQVIPTCDLGKSVAIAQIITDVICDTILVIMPMVLLLRTNLDWQLKIRVVSLFGTTIITTAVSIYHASCIIQIPGGATEQNAATIQATISLLIASLPVVVAQLLRIGRDTDTDEVDNTHRIRSRPRRNPQNTTLGLVSTTAIGEAPVNVLVVHTEQLKIASSHFDADVISRGQGDVSALIVDGTGTEGDSSKNAELEVLTQQHT